MKKCVHCNNELENECFYWNAKKNNFSSYCKECESKRKKKQLINFKKQCLGHKNQFSCIKCGYEKNLNALDFHHKDPKNKDFNISKVKKLILNEDIKNELDKCDVLCSNCHREMHSLELFDFDPKILKPRSKTFCFDCNQECTYLAQRCFSCEQKKKKNISKKPDKSQLIEDLDKLKTFTSIGKKYGVSANTIKKWVKSYCLYKR